MAPKIIASATAAASWVNRRKASSRNNNRGKKGNDGSDRAASPFSKIGDTAKTSVSSSEKSGSSDQDDCDGHFYLGEKASKMDVNKSRRRPRSSTVQKVDHTDDHGPSRVASDGLNKQQQDRRIKQKSKKSLAKTSIMTPPRHQQVSTTNNDRRSKRRSHSESGANKCNKTPPSLSKQKLRNRQHPPQENNSPASGHNKLSRYIEQRSNNINNSHCNSKDDERGGREKQIASSATATTTNNTDDDVSSSTTPNKYYQPYRCRNIQSDQDNNITETKDAAVVNGRRNYHSQYNERSRSKSMPQQSTYRPGTSPLIRKQAYFNTENTATTEGNGARVKSKKQLSSFEQQLLQQGPLLPLPQSTFDERSRKQLSFEEQLRRQKPLPTRPLSFEQQLLHQKPLPGTNNPLLSFEQQLLQQEPPHPFGLPRSLSESLGVTPSTSDDLTSVSFEQQLRQQPELINYYNNFRGLPSSPQHQHVQSSFADATANSDGSSVIYFRNDSGRVILGSQRGTSLPPSLGGSGGSMEESVYEESDYDDDGYEDEYDSSTDWSDIERQSQAMSKSRGGVSSPASSSSSSPQGVDGVTTFRHGNVGNGRSTAVPPLARKTTYNTAMEVAPPHSLQTQPNLTQMNHPPSLSLHPNQYPLPHQPPPPQLNGDTITPEEYQRLQLESELVRARMLEIEERIRAIESKRGITHGGGVQDTGLRDVGSGQEGSIVWSSSGSEGESDDSYYSDSEDDEEEEDEDTIGDLLSSVSLLNQSKRRHRSYGDRDEDENTITPFLSSTSLTMRPLEEDNNENEESEEANIEIHKNMVSVSSLYCEGNSSYVSIATKDEDDSSAAETDHNDSEQESEERSTDTTASKRRVRFEDEEQYQSAYYPVSHHTSVQPPAETNTTDNPISRHHKPLERKSTHSSTSSASTNMSSLLEHAPLEEHLKGIKQRRSKLLELVEAQDQNRNDSKTKRSIEFSLFLMKDKLNQLQALGVLGEDGEEDLLKSGDAHRLLGEIRSDGGTNESE